MATPKSGDAMLKLMSRKQPTLDAAMRYVWTDSIIDKRARNVRFWPSEPKGRWVFYRPQGDVLRFAQVELAPPFADSTMENVIKALDMDIAYALDSFAAHPLSVSEALEAGERRRLRP